MITKDSLKSQLTNLRNFIPDLNDFHDFIMRQDFEKAAKLRDKLVDEIYEALCEKCSECHREIKK